MGVFFIKSILSKNINQVLIHSHNATLHADFFASLKCAILNNPLILYYCFIPEPTLIKTIYKQNNYEASKFTINDSIIQEPEAFPPLNVKSLKIDTDCFIERSCPKDKDFLSTLIDTYDGAISTGPSDIGKIHKPEYHMDIEILDNEMPLPLDLPYPTSHIN